MECWFDSICLLSHHQLPVGSLISPHSHFFKTAYAIKLRRQGEAALPFGCVLVSAIV